MEQNTTTKTFVEFFYPGILVSDSESREVKSRRKPRNIPSNSFGYRFYDITVVTMPDGEELRGDRKNTSPMHYFGEVLTLEDVKKLRDKNKQDYDILYSNMKNNGYDRVVNTKFGTSHPLKDDDIVLKKKQ